MRVRFFLKVFLIFIFVLVILLLFSEKERATTQQLSGQKLFLETEKFFDENLFFAGVNKSTKSSIYSTKINNSFVVPHHLLASPIIADAFRSLSEKPPKTLFIIGPNHENKGTNNIVVTSNFWNTPFGEVQPDQDTITNLLKSGVLVEENDVFLDEQSIATLLPFVKYFLPTTKTVPVLIKRTTSLSEIQAFSESIKNYLSPDFIFVFSIDFSHGLGSDEAQRNDDLLLELSYAKDYEKILNLDKTYLDSPPTLVTFLLLKEQKNIISDFTVLLHSNSSTFTKEPFQEVTSYYSLAY